jgi:cathepsin A (carboxypeptidase C)
MQGNSLEFATSTYSGYLDVNADKSLHYVFVESKSENAAKDPVLIWFNGGPGCSSLLGFFQENGPVVVDDNGTVYENPHPWNERANVLYIESPAGVGYSIARTEEAMNHNDMSQSEDAFAALEQFYIKYPEYKENELFVSGESYGGVYVPYLSW